MCVRVCVCIVMVWYGTVRQWNTLFSSVTTMVSSVQILSFFTVLFLPFELRIFLCISEVLRFSSYLNSHTNTVLRDDGGGYDNDDDDDV